MHYFRPKLPTSHGPRLAEPGMGVGSLTERDLRLLQHELDEAIDQGDVRRADRLAWTLAMASPA